MELNRSVSLPSLACAGVRLQGVALALTIPAFARSSSDPRARLQGFEEQKGQRLEDAHDASARLRGESLTLSFPLQFAMRASNAPQPLDASSCGAPVWGGVLDPSTCWLSAQDARRAMDVVVRALEVCVSGGLMDYVADAPRFSAYGRHYGECPHGMAEFAIQVYVREEGFPGRGSALEIRRVAGDALVHAQGLQRLLELLRCNGVLSREGLASPKSASDSAFAIPRGYPAAEWDAEDEADLVDSKDDDSCVALLRSVDECLETMTRGDAYREEHRCSAGFLASIAARPAVCKHLCATRDELVEDLLKVLAGELFDTLVVRDTLLVVRAVLSLQKQTRHTAVRSALRRSSRGAVRFLQLLKDRWEGTPVMRVGEMSIVFAASQQVIRLANDCLTLL